MKFLKKLYWSLIIRYVVFLGTAVIITIAFIVALAMTMISVLGGHFSENPEDMKGIMIPIKSVEYNDTTKEFEVSPQLPEEVWFEVLKDNKVIFIQGKKLDEKMEYTQEEIAMIANNVDEMLKTSSGKNGIDIYNTSYEYIPFKGTDGENYTLLMRRPDDSEPYTIGSDFDLTTIKPSGVEKELRIKGYSFIFVFILSIIGIILLFSRLTSKKIIKPLNELNKGVDKVIKGDYTVRLDFKGSYEFQQLRDAFNHMAEMLQEAQRENRRISDSKKRLLLDISHDLRTPATTIQGYAEALNSGLVDDEDKKKRYLEYIFEKSKRVTDLIDTLFKYSKLESSVYDLNKEINDLSEFLRNIIISFYGELEDKEFNLDIRIPNEKILFNFDKIELERGISNIISNVIKYNSKDTTLTVSLEEVKDGIEINICDDGVGIPDPVQSDIFNALVRGDNARKTDGGMGLGLAISKKIVELHGGSITLTSEEGKGTKFCIKFKR